MNKAIALLGGLGVGAALMYLFDPDGGNRRRALIRDKAGSLNRKTQQAISGRAEDLKNRAKGLLHETRSALTPETAEESTQPSYNN